eukprot:661871-Hanusia_phi.AAC.6
MARLLRGLRGSLIYERERWVKLVSRWEFMTVLRSHTLDVCDLSWSPSSLQLVSASVDNTATVDHSLLPVC